MRGVVAGDRLRLWDSFTHAKPQSHSENMTWARFPLVTQMGDAPDLLASSPSLGLTSLGFRALGLFLRETQEFGSLSGSVTPKQIILEATGTQGAQFSSVDTTAKSTGVRYLSCSSS